MDILFVTQYFYPENFRINDLAERLVKKGHKVTVLTGIPNYPKGEFYQGYGIFKKRTEKYKGIKIIRVPVIPRHVGNIWLSLNYLSFIVSGCLKAAELSAYDFDVVYAFGTSPITQALPALVMKKLTGAKVILNVQDLWPDNIIAVTGIKRHPMLTAIDHLVDFIYNRSDVILGTSKSFVKAIRSRKRLRIKAKVGYYPQFAVVKKSDEVRRDILPEGEFHLVFTGNVGEGQGLDKVIEAAKYIAANAEPFECGTIVFDIVGDGRARKRLMEKTIEFGLQDMVRFHGYFPEDEIPGILNTADAALLILKDSPIFENTIPAKLQTYLACGCAVLGCVKGEARHIIEKNGIGICTRDMSSRALAESVLAFVNLSEKRIENMREQSLTYSEREFNPEYLTDRLEGFMKTLSKAKNKL